MSEFGPVTLAGCGPGEISWVNQAVTEAVASADVVIYDRLIPLELLKAAPPYCELVAAGKTSGDHTMTQDEINEAIVAHATRGMRVVRLKGGDPYLFGRGGEEVIACREAGVECFVIPGVTSAFAVPAAAGIPVTHRNVSQLVTVVTASTGDPAQPDPDYAWLAQSQGTLVFLMGLKKVAHIAESLMTSGARRDLPIAVISRGATPQQKTVVGTLETIADLAAGGNLASPGIVVVGEVVNLREQLSLFEERSLFGLSIAVTRARAQASELANTLKKLGADVVEAPVIRIAHTDDPTLGAAVNELGKYSDIICTSPNGAELLLAEIYKNDLDSRVFAGLRISCVGPSTAAVFAGAGIRADVVPAAGSRTARGLANTLAQLQWIPGPRALLVRAAVGDEYLPETLRTIGWTVDVVAAYETIAEKPSPEDCARALAADIVVFTAASTVANFLEHVVDGDGKTPPCVTIGPTTTRAARDAGFEVVGIAETPGISQLVNAVVSATALLRDREVSVP